MAEVSFTDTALLHIRAVMATSPLVEPIVSVVWWKGVMDNIRTPEGKAVWSVVEEPKWFAFVSDWHEHRDLPVKDYLRDINGLSVYLDPTAKSTPGTLVVSLTERGLAVEHTAA